MKIDVFNINSLRAEDDFGYLGFVKRKLPLLPLTDSAAGYTVGLKEAANKFPAAVDEFDDVLEKAKSLPSTKEATKKDEERDKAWAVMRAYVRVSKGHPNAEIADFALKAEEVFLRYGDMMPLAHQEETARMHNLVQDLKALDTTKMNQAGFTPFSPIWSRKRRPTSPSPTRRARSTGAAWWASSRRNVPWPTPPIADSWRRSMRSSSSMAKRLTKSLS